MTITAQQLRKLLPRLIPSFTGGSRKGQHGRIGVVGGSIEYTGAPYYAGISSLKTGADMCHVFCAEEAATPIKCYSPELIVHPFLRSEASLKGLSSSERSDALKTAAESIAKVFPRLDTLIIGPGLGRDESVQEITRQLIQRARENNLQIVLDGDGLYFVSLAPEMIHGYSRSILTPNTMEYARLCVAAGLMENADPAEAVKIPPSELSKALGSVIVIQKGREDKISDGESTVQAEEFGSPRRCGGQGDVLTGAIATFASWTKNFEISKEEFAGNPLMLAGFGGSLLVRASSAVAFRIHQRSMTAPDVLQSIGEGFTTAFPSTAALPPSGI